MEDLVGGSLLSWIPRLHLQLLVLAFSAGSVAADDGAPPFSHDTWAAVLERFVDDEGWVDYHGLEADRAELDRYVASLAAVSPMSHPNLFPTREEALAYYINAYNAQVFVGVLALGPDVKSVWPTLWAGYKFFMQRKFKLGDEKFHLKGLEDRQIREGFGDARIHAALNCASVACPRLPREPFLGAILDKQLDAVMVEFAEDPRHVRLDAAAGKVHLSKIFDWFSKDFLDDERRLGNAGGTLIDAVNRYRRDQPPIPREYSVQFMDYDKSLNGQKR